MKIVIILFFFQTAAFAQCDTTNFVEFPDVEAEFPGGAAKMMKFIKKNIEYPDSLELDNFDGRLRFVFFVCADGSIVPAKTSMTNNDEFDQTKTELLHKMPNWIPAKVEGRNVTTKAVITMHISLN